MLVATSVIEVGHRRAERDRDADRGGRALRPLAAPPAARPRGARRARLALHPVRRPDAAAPRGDRQRARRLPARRGGPRAARRGRRARHAPARAAGVPGGAAARGRGAAGARPRPRRRDARRRTPASSSRSTRCCARPWWRASARSSTRSRHDRDAREARPHVRAGVARGRPGGRARRPARGLRVGRAGPPGRGGPPRPRRRHRVLPRLDRPVGRLRTRSGQLEPTGPDTVLATGHDARSRPARAASRSR